jgi:hypothetical protein
MADRELSTRDLAETPDNDTAPADEPLARERSDPESDATGRTQSEHAAADASVDEQGPLLPDDQSERFTTRWQEIQTGFVDEPRDSVAKADALVADLMQRLAAGFSEERERLEAQWDRGDDVSTEDLRVALTRYRSFFDRLLSA